MNEADQGNNLMSGFNRRTNLFYSSKVQLRPTCFHSVIVERIRLLYHHGQYEITDLTQCITPKMLILPPFVRTSV